VEKGKRSGDFVISLSAHWGDEQMLKPIGIQWDYAKYFADLAVDDRCWNNILM